MRAAAHTSWAFSAMASRSCSRSGVSVTLSRESYPELTYGDLTLPSGEYASLKVSLGEAGGQNWWCVLYPSICTSGAKASGVMKQIGFSPDQVSILTDGEKPVYKLKFKLLEFIFGNGS